MFCFTFTLLAHWQGFQLYMLAIVLVLPSLIMTIAYSAISRKLLSLSSSSSSACPNRSLVNRNQSLERLKHPTPYPTPY